MIFISPKTSSFLSVSRALSLSSSLDKLKSEYVDLKHQVAESIINPARLSIEELQGELKTELEKLSKFELAKLGTLELAKLRELQLSLPSTDTCQTEGHQLCKDTEDSEF